MLQWKPTNGIREYTTNPYVYDEVTEHMYWDVVSPLDDIDQHFTRKYTYNFINQGSL
jgi:hypothetical protein